MVMTVTHKDTKVFVMNEQEIDEMVDVLDEPTVEKMSDVRCIEALVDILRWFSLDQTIPHKYKIAIRRALSKLRGEE